MTPDPLAEQRRAVRDALSKDSQETRAEVIGRLLGAINDAICAGDFAVIEIGDEPVNSNNVADCLIALGDARDAVERIR